MPRYGKLNGTNLPVNGFELHCGRSTKCESNDDAKSDCWFPLVSFVDIDKSKETSTEDGTQVGNVKGTYIHGILKTKAVRYALLTDECVTNEQDGEQQDHIDKFAQHLEHCGLDYDQIKKMLI
jgi:cobyric acid synthase